MKRMMILVALCATPAVAQEAKPAVMWNMVVQLKANILIGGYQSEDRCKEAMKLIAPHLKKVGQAYCLPILSQ